ncbi:MAG: chitobiase/beta-hexosaminidase C-terminal domain-containing protein [Prevotella sp.]|nr:chitobiase/beta-hexosaminidase C-terminal domain-containing protein [Prevotella sp.]
MTRIMSNNKETMSLTRDHMKRSSYLRRFTVTALITLLMTLVGRGEAYSDELYDALVYSQNYEGFDEGILTAADIGWTFQWKKTAAQAKIKKVSDDDNLSKYLELWYNDGGANRHQWWDFGAASKLDRDNWTLSFSAIMNGANNSPYKFFISGTNSGNVNTASTDVSNPVFALIGNATNGTEYTAYIANTAVATDVTLSKNVWYNFVVAVSDIDATQNTAVIHVKVTNYNDNATVFEATEKGVAINSIGSLRGICWDSPRNGSLLALDNVKITMKRPKLDITYNKGEDTAVKGDAPVGESVIPNTTWTPPVNTSLYKSEYTLTGWTDTNDKVYSVGTDYVLNEDLTFSPLFRLNAVAKTDALTNVTATFPTVFFTENGTEKYNVVQTAFNGETQDVYVKVDGKTLTFDAINGIKLTLPAGVSASDFTINSGSISADGQVLTYSGSNETVTLTYSGSAENVNGLVFTYPLTEKPVISTNIEKDSYEVKVDDELSLSITTLNMENGTYQWYSNTTASTEGGKTETGANTSSFVVPTSEANNGVTYYYCVATNSFGSATSKIVGVTVNATPVIHTDIANDAYALSIGDSQTLSVSAYNMQVTGSNYQWYSNTTQSTEGGTAVSGATSSTFSVPTAVAGTTYYYCVAENAYGKDTSKVVAVAVADYVTFDFKNWSADDAELGNLWQWNTDANGNRVYEWVAKGSYSGWAQQPLLYPYAMAGYIGLTYGEFALVNGTGLYDNHNGTGRDRPVNFYDLKAGDILVLRGTNLLATDVYDAGNNGNGTFDILINDAATEAYVIALTDGHLSFMRGSLSKNRVLEYAMVPNKYAPTITTDLDGQSYTLSRNETKTLTVAAKANDANPLRYQWYRNDVDSNKGGRAIDGANSATYTTVEGESYYYYCVVFNSVTGAAVATTKTTHVQCKPQVSYVNNDADAIGDVPATEVIEIGKKFTIESRNYQLLKSGYTLTGWTDGTNTYEFGKSYDIVNDIVLNPVFRANEQSLSAIIKVTTFTWPFATSKDAPTVNWTDGETHVLAAQQAVTGELQDFGAKVVSTGFATGAATATVAEGTTIKIPMKYGTTIELFTSGETPSATVLTTDLKTPRNMTVDGSTLTYTYKGNNDELTMTLGAGAYDSLRVHYVPTGMPVFAKDLEANYYLEVGKDSTLTVDATEGVTFQWYRNTTHSNEGGTKIVGATSASYTVSSDVPRKEYFYVSITNNYGTVYSQCAEIEYFKYKTFNFLDIAHWNAVGPGLKADESAVYNIKHDRKAYGFFYPYELAGYMGQDQNNSWYIRTDKAGFGMYNNTGTRVFILQNMKVGHHVTIVGSAVNNANWDLTSVGKRWGEDAADGAAHYDYKIDGNKIEIDITKSGFMMLESNKQTGIFSVTMPDLNDPVITKDLETTYVVDREEPLTLEVEAELSYNIDGHSLSYQWYKSETNSNRNGVAIDGATAASYEIKSVTENAFYYCLVKNRATGTVTPSAVTAVGFYLGVTFANNDVAAYGEAPKMIKTQGGLPVTMPKNQTLIKDGYTLTGWTDGTTTTAIGAEFTPKTDVTLYPVFTKNADNVSLQKRSEEMTVRWVFATENGSAEYNDTVSANVLQPIINGEAIDVGIKMTKGDNQTNEMMASNGWMAANNGNFTLPVVKGARIALTVYYPTDITINGENITYNATYGEQGAVRYVYAYTGSEKEITLNIANNYIKDLEIYYPAPELLSTNAATYNVYIDNAKVARKSAVITLTGKNLNPGSTVTLTKDAKASNITIDSETFTVGSDGTLSQQILVTYKGTAAQAQDNTVLTFVYSEDTNARATVTYGREAAFTGTSGVTPVSIKTVWDWSNAASLINPAQDVYMAFKDIELGDKTWPEGFTAENLAGSGTYYANNISKCFEGKELYFETKCKGTIDVEFSAASGNNITLAVNGENTSFNSTSTNSVTAKKIPVGVGGVLLQAHTTGLTTGEQYMRIYKVTFTPDANKPVITLDKTTSSFTLQRSADINYPEGDPAEVLYYTTDGSEPSLTSESTEKYMGEPVSLITNVMIKAMAVAPNKNNSDVDSVQTDMRTYKLNVGVYPANSGRVIATPMAENYEYTENATVTLKAEAASGYGLSAWATSRADIANGAYIHTGESSITVNVNTTSNEYWAVFEDGETVKVEYDFSKSEFLENDGEVSPNMKTEYFTSSIVSNSIFVPKNYPVYVGYGDGVDKGSKFSLIYWKDENGKRYEKGSNTVVNKAGQTYTLHPVFQKNPGMEPLEGRVSSYDITWDFRHSEYAHPLTLPAGVTSFYTRDAVMSYQENKDQTVDIAIQIDTRGVTNTDGLFAEKAFTNEDDDDWASISKGTKITIPSSYGAKITLATYKPIIAGEGGTKINGIAPDNVYEENVQRDGEAYLYTWTIKDNAASVVLTIGDLDYAFYKYIHADYPNTETTYFKLSSNNDVMGTVSAVNTGNENDHGTVSDLGLGFNRNSSVTLTAERNRFYELKYWITGKGTKFFPDGTYQSATDDSPKPIGESVTSDDITFTHVNGDTVVFTLKRYFEIQAVFGPRESYTINFMSGQAVGDALPVQRVEIGEKFDMPANNYNLYKEGYTLQYYISADSVDIPSAHHYEFGKSYPVSNDMLLLPVFTANTKSVYDVADENGRTVTWNVNQMKFSFANSNGRMVSQLAVDDYNTIDVQCYFAVRKNEVYYRINSSGVLELSSAANLQILSTSDCKFTVNAAAPAVFQKGSITIASDETLQGASVSKDITTTSNIQSIVFNSPATVQSISVKYNKIDKPRNLKSVKIGETSLTAEQVATLNSTTTLTYNCDASDIYAAQGAMPTVTAEALINDTDKGVVDVTQATVDNPVATLYLRYKVSDTDKVTLRTFTINFNITSKEAPAFVSAKVNDSKVEDGKVTALQNTSGVICLAFDHPMVAKNVVINDKTFTATAVGDTVKLHYWALQPDTPYNFTIPANTFEDIYGVKCTTPIPLSFTTAAATAVASKLFNYIVTHKIVWDSFTQEMKDTVQIVPDDVIENLAKQGDIEYGTLEEGLIKANAAGGTERYRIFVPDGEYNIRGTSPLTSTDVNGNLWGKDLNGTPTQTVALTMTDYKDHVFYNGRSILSSDNISIIGQSQDSTIIYSDPRVCGLYRSPIFSISNNVKGTYMQDFTLENRFCNSMGNQPDAYLKASNVKVETGGAPSIVDNGYHTVAKYVTLKAHDGTYVSSPVEGQQTDNYYEDCQLWGMHYPLLRTGQTWWQNPKVVLRYNSKRPACLSCIEHFSTQPWGYILKDGVFTAENAAARSKNEKAFCLGTLVRYSPVQTLLNMKFDVASAAVGYDVRIQGGDEVIRFHEYGSVSAAGVPVDLSTRSTSIFSPGAGSDDYVLTANQAAEYTIENMFGSGEAYDPRVHTAQVDLDGVVLSQTDEGITWNGNSQAICYFIFRQNTETGNFEFFDICQNEVYTPRDEANADGMVFYVRAANERGGLGKPSNTIKYKKLGWYDLTVVHKEGLAETGDTSDDWKGWSTICLARNAKVPTQSINEDGTFGNGKISVYAAQEGIDGTTIHMKKVKYLKEGMGYVVFATTGETEKTYRFNYTWETNELSTLAHNSFLDGNKSDDTVSVGTVNCYTMAYKKTINPDCVGFYKFIGEKIPPHRAYLTVETAASMGFILDTEANAKKVRFVFEDSDEEFFFYEGDEDADGIRNVRSSEVDPEAVFDLSGKRLDKSQLRKGMVYVIGGKKVLWNGE